MKLVSGERAAVSGMKHGSILIMHSSSSEHFRTGRERDGTWLQIGAASPLRLCWALVPRDVPLSKPIFEVPPQLSKLVKPACSFGKAHHIGPATGTPCLSTPDSASLHRAQRELIFLAEEQMLLWDPEGETTHECRTETWGQAKFLHERLYPCRGRCSASHAISYLLTRALLLPSDQAFKTVQGYT
ncbi:hypothetical protein QYF61_025850 [Mycteria americana]|uniref:Uncharacterized protein n=1 Tax=Mycteria americana TaxID=33587 RepID=A0AAN7RZT6_MYCAM|nr:hypothetical protein QYF61_025850 [Mycteria americana]